MPTLILITEINAPLKRCFDLARSIDLHQLSTAHTGEKAIAGKTTGLIGLNEEVTWRAKHFGIWQHLSTKITELIPSSSFTDVMVKGAFQTFKHYHQFSYENGKTIMRDEFIYKSPFGILGKLVNVFILNKYMSKLLYDRNQVIKKYAETELWKEVLD